MTLIFDGIDQDSRVHESRQLFLPCRAQAGEVLPRRVLDRGRPFAALAQLVLGGLIDGISQRPLPSKASPGGTTGAVIAHRQSSRPVGA
jgi:hypothetical protein